jgi:hypothetical protein
LASAEYYSYSTEFYDDERIYEKLDELSTEYCESDIDDEIDSNSILENQNNNEKIDKSIGNKSDLNKSDFDELFEDIEPTKAQSKSAKDSLKSDSQTNKGHSQ